MSELHTPVAEVHLLVEQPRQRLRYWCGVLAALDAPRAPRLVSAVAHYDSSSELAVLQLQYDRVAFDDVARKYVVNVALDARVGMIQPDELSETDRQRFLVARLARCKLRGTSQSTVIGALTELVHEVTSRPSRAAATPPPIPSARPSKTAIGTPRPSLVAATGTRDDLETRIVVREADDDSSTTSPYEGPRIAARGSTPPRYDDDERITSPLGVHTLGVIAANKATPDRIHVRYLQAGRWLTARVGAIGLNGAALLTSALPRVKERIEVELAFGAHRAVVMGMVSKTPTGEEVSNTGAATFTVKFVLDDQSREGLFALLLAVREQC